MIAFLKGILMARTANEIVVDVNNIGYLVYVSLKTSKKLGDINSKVDLFTKMIVKENDISLYGFINQEEKNAFELLTTIQGVGTKSALNILSILDPNELLVAIKQNNLKAFQEVDGVGPKLATRIIAELATKASKMSIIENQKTNISNENINQLKATLKSLGFDKNEIETKLEKLNKEDKDLSINMLLAKALKATFN
jgi:Holliday junction DNA helicase RuvA